MQKIRIIIAGGRKFNNYEILDEFVGKILTDHILKNEYHIKRSDVEIVSGRAVGPDQMGE